MRLQISSTTLHLKSRMYFADFTATPNLAIPEVMNFAWSVERHDGYLLVSAHYGGGGARDNICSVRIPLHSESPVSMNSSVQNGEIYVKGSVRAVWSADHESYCVMFKGEMLRPGLNAVESHAGEDGGEIVVHVALRQHGS